MIPNTGMKDQRKQMSKQVDQQARELDRALFALQRTKREAEQKLKKQIAKGPNGNAYSKKIYAKQVLDCNKRIDQTNINKAKIKGMQYQMDNVMNNMKMAQVMGQAGNLMGQVNKQFNVQQVTKATNKFTEGMMKMQITADMLDDALDSGDVDINIEQQAEKMLHNMEMNIQMGMKKPTVHKPVIQMSQEDKLLEQFQRKMANY